MACSPQAADRHCLHLPVHLPELSCKMKAESHPASELASQPYSALHARLICCTTTGQYKTQAWLLGGHPSLLTTLLQCQCASIRTRPGRRTVKSLPHCCSVKSDENRACADHVELGHAHACCLQPSRLKGIAHGQGYTAACLRSVHNRHTCRPSPADCAAKSPCMHATRVTTFEGLYDRCWHGPQAATEEVGRWLHGMSFSDGCHTYCCCVANRGAGTLLSSFSMALRQRTAGHGLHGKLFLLAASCTVYLVSSELLMACC